MRRGAYLSDVVGTLSVRLKVLLIKYRTRSKGMDMKIYKAVDSHLKYRVMFYDPRRSIDV